MYFLLQKILSVQVRKKTSEHEKSKTFCCCCRMKAAPSKKLFQASEMLFFLQETGMHSNTGLMMPSSGVPGALVCLSESRTEEREKLFHG